MGTTKGGGGVKFTWSADFNNQFGSFGGSQSGFMIRTYNGDSKNHSKGFWFDLDKVLEDNGIQVLVRTNDVNVTEQLISKSFGMPQENFKILSSVAGRLFKRRRDAVTDKLPARIVHDGTAYSMLKSVAAACDVASKVKIGSIVQIILSVLGFVFSMALYCGSAGAVFSGLTAAAFLGAGLLISAGAMIIGKIK